jgi:hypothetical protein
VDGQQISGFYEVVFNPVINCAIWAGQAQPSSTMEVAADGEGNVQVLLDPGISSNTQLLTGSQYLDGQINASEQLNPELGIPNSQVNGSFSEGPDGLQFNGALTLTAVLSPTTSGSGTFGTGGGNTSTIGGGGAGGLNGTTTGGAGCSQSYTMTASFQAPAN